MPTLIPTTDYPDTTGLEDEVMTHCNIVEFSCNHDGSQNGWILNCRRPAGHEMPHMTGYTFMARWND